MTLRQLSALFAIVAVAGSVAAEEAEHFSSATLEVDGECTAGSGAPCAVSALQRRALQSEALEAEMPASLRGDNTSASSEDEAPAASSEDAAPAKETVKKTTAAPATSSEDAAPAKETVKKTTDAPTTTSEAAAPAKEMVLVGEGFCCWDEKSCKPDDEDEKESPGGALFATEDGTQCHDAVACGGTVMELCGRTEGCEAITVFAKSSPDAYAWDCQLHWGSSALCSTLCDAPPNDNACSKKKLPAAFQACGRWYGECENMTAPITEIRADGTKDRWCYKKKA